MRTVDPSHHVGVVLTAAAALLLTACSGTPSGGAGAGTSAPSVASPSPSTSTASPSTTMPAQPGTVTATDDFNNEKKHLFRDANASDARVGVVMGVYRILLKKDDLPHGEIRDVSDKALAISIAATMSAIDLPSGFLGPICFYDAGYGFSLKMSPDGTASLAQVSMQGKEIDVLASQQIEGYDPATPTALRLDCTWGLDQSTVEGWVGSTYLGPAHEPAKAGANFWRGWAAIGFWGMTTQAPSTVIVGDVSISEDT